MSDDELLDVINEQEPALSRFRDVVCRGCNIFQCHLNFRQHKGQTSSLGALGGLKDGLQEERSKKGEEVLSELISEEQKTELEQIGIACEVFQSPSRKNPVLYFQFSRKQGGALIKCEIGKKRLFVKQFDEWPEYFRWLSFDSTNEEPLVSAEQLANRIQRVIATLKETS